MKTTLLVIFGLTAFMACEDKITNTNINVNDILIPEYNENGKIYEKTTQIENHYDDNNQLIKSSAISNTIEQNSAYTDTSISICSYNENGKLIIEKDFYNNNNVPRFTRLFSYNNNNKLIKEVWVYKGKDTNNVLTNAYNESGQLISEKRFSLIPGGGGSYDTSLNYNKFYNYKSNNKIAYEISIDKTRNSKDSIIYEYKDTTLVKKLWYSEKNSTTALDKITTYVNFGDSIKQELTKKDGGDTIKFTNKKYKNGLIEKEYSYTKRKNEKHYYLYDTKGNKTERVFIDPENKIISFDFYKYDKQFNLIETKTVSKQN